MSSQPFVLCIGEDASLLNLRCKVLATRLPGVLCTTPDNLPGMLLRQRLSVVVLCHTLSPAACTLSLHLIREHCPGTPVLSLFTATAGCLDAVDAAILATDGPARLLQAIETLQFPFAPLLLPGPAPTAKIALR